MIIVLSRKTTVAVKKNLLLKAELCTDPIEHNDLAPVRTDLVTLNKIY